MFLSARERFHFLTFGGSGQYCIFEECQAQKLPYFCYSEIQRTIFKHSFFFNFLNLLGMVHFL